MFSLTSGHRCALAVAVLCVATEVGAAAFQVDARTEAQAYELRAYRGTSFDRPVLLPRRRIVQYLGLNAWELVTGADFGFESNLRVFQDFGLDADEAARLDGIRTRDADLLYASLRYRGNGLDAQLGRLLYGDVGDTLSIDGLRVRYVTPFRVGAEAYGGYWVRGAGFLSSSVYQPDGVRESDARRIAQHPDPGSRDPALAIDPGLSSPSPVYGAKLLLQNLQGFSGAVGYRRSLVGRRTDYERAHLELSYGKTPRGLNALGGLEYDLFQLSLSQARLSVRYDQPLWSLSLEGMRLQPTFSAHSIWYYFAYAPRHEARLRVDLTPVGPLRYYAQGLYAAFDAPLNAGTGLASIQDSGSGASGGASAGAAARWTSLRAQADVTYRNGYGGRQLWFDVNLGYSGAGGRWTLDTRFSSANVADPYNRRLRGTFYGMQLWGSYALTRASRFSVAVEQNLNPFTDSDTKVFLLFDVKAVL